MKFKFTLALFMCAILLIGTSDSVRVEAASRVYGSDSCGAYEKDGTLLASASIHAYFDYIEEDSVWVARDASNNLLIYTISTPDIGGSGYTIRVYTPYEGGQPNQAVYAEAVFEFRKPTGEHYLTTTADVHCDVYGDVY